MAWSNKLTAEVQALPDVTQQHVFPSIFPFDATNVIPLKPLFAEIVSPEERMRELEEKATKSQQQLDDERKREQHIQLAERTLV